uniref:Saposin B-type domain-containing protein n=1 Tax=Plectus sambesii TaxID=2011161 RepID=A0A914WRV9_9BILA
MRLLLCVALLVIAVAFVNAQDFPDKQQVYDVEESNAFGQEEEVERRGKMMCILCTELMFYAKVYANQTQKRLASLLKSVCKTAFKGDRNELQRCNSIVDQNVSLIMRFINTKLSPQAVCRSITLC